MRKPAFWNALRDWAGVVGAFAMVLALTLAPSLLRDAPPATRLAAAAAASASIEIAAAPQAGLSGDAR